MGVISIIFGLIILSLMMLVHELGHFWAGKLLGFKILSFNIFMGPVLLRKRGKDGVDYQLRALPLGASVEFAGESEESLTELAEMAPEERPFSADDPGLFYKRPRWARAIVIAMGPAMNFITAFLALLLCFALFSVPLPVIGQMDADGAAARSGFQVGDRILAYNGHTISTDMDLAFIQSFDRRAVNQYLIERQGKKLTLDLHADVTDKRRLGISYDPQTLEVLAVDPQSNNGHPVIKVGDRIISVNGLSLSDSKAIDQLLASDQPLQVRVTRKGAVMDLSMQASMIKMISEGYRLGYAKTAGEMISAAALYPWSIIRQTVLGIGRIFAGKLAFRDAFAGPVLLVSTLGSVVNNGFDWGAKIHMLLMYFALISIAIGFTNLLPIPALDGSHLLILGVEAVRRKDLSARLKQRLAMVGLACLLALGVVVIYFDIVRLMG